LFPYNVWVKKAETKKIYKFKNSYCKIGKRKGYKGFPPVVGQGYIYLFAFKRKQMNYGTPFSPTRFFAGCAQIDKNKGYTYRNLSKQFIIQCKKPNATLNRPALF
jgi:hypothetical protein